MRGLRSFHTLAVGLLALAATAAAPLAATTAPLTAPVVPLTTAGAAPAGSAWPFIENGGRFTDEVAFATSTRHGAVYVTRDGRLITDFVSSGGADAPARITETFAGTTIAPRGAVTSTTRVHRFFGADSRHWGPLAAFDALALGSPWPGIEVRLALRNGAVERLFEVAPGADAGAIRVRLEGVERLASASDGGLELATPAGVLRLSPPVAWQGKGEATRQVGVAYVRAGTGYGFALGPHDPALPVVIDPLLQSTFVGSTGSETVVAVAAGTDRVYAAGNSQPLAFPGGPPPATFGAGGMFVAAYSPDLTQLLALTFFGGTGIDYVFSLTPDGGGVYLAGTTFAADFPGTASGARPSLATAPDGFVIRLSTDLGTLVRATYLGGDGFDDVQGLATGSALFAFGNTQSSDLPATAGAAQTALAGTSDTYAAAFSLDLTTLTRVTYLGGSGGEAALGEPGLAAGGLYVTGETLSADFPQVAGGYQTTNTLSAAFVAHLSLDLSQIVQSTYFGSDFGIDSGFQAAVDGDVFILGRTNGSDLPGTTGGVQPAYGGLTDLFVARFPPTLTSLVRATYVGGSDSEDPGGLLVRAGEVIVSGATASTDLPGTTGAIQPNRVGPSDGFLARFDASLTGPSHATYLGGNGNNGISDHDELAGVLYVGGSVEIDDFPGTAGGAQESYAGGDYDGFLAALTSDLVQLPTVSVDDVAGLEGNSGTTPWVFTVSLSAAPESPATVTVATAAGTASSGVDFAPLGPLVLTFLPAGPTTQTVTVQIQGDPGVEPDETFSLVLSLPTGLELGDAAGTGTILNDDQSVVEIPTLSPAGLAGLALALAAAALARVRRGNH